MAKVINFVYKFRTDKRLTQENLAKSVGVSRQTIIAIEKGNYTPSVFLAMKLAKHFKLKVENLFEIKRSR